MNKLLLVIMLMGIIVPSMQWLRRRHGWRRHVRYTRLRRVYTSSSVHNHVHQHCHCRKRDAADLYDLVASADLNQDGFVDKQESDALYEREMARGVDDDDGSGRRSVYTSSRLHNHVHQHCYCTKRAAEDLRDLVISADLNQDGFVDEKERDALYEREMVRAAEDDDDDNDQDE